MIVDHQVIPKSSSTQLDYEYLNVEAQNNYEAELSLATFTLR